MLEKKIHATHRTEPPPMKPQSLRREPPKTALEPVVVLPCNSQPARQGAGASSHNTRSPPAHSILNQQTNKRKPHFGFPQTHDTQDFSTPGNPSDFGCLLDHSLRTVLPGPTPTVPHRTTTLLVPRPPPRSPRSVISESRSLVWLAEASVCRLFDPQPNAV